MMTAEQLQQAWKCSEAMANKWALPVKNAMYVFGIDSLLSQAAYLATIGHESGRGVYAREIWGPTPAQKRYEGRKDLGNIHPGDGKRYMGRGLIQITGRANYVGARDGLLKVFPDTPDFEAMPHALEEPKWAAYSSGWFWQSRGLNVPAEAGDFERVTRRVNGGLNGYEDRLALLSQAHHAIHVA